MATSSSSTEARELALIDKVELRIALADTDTKLQNILKTYLPPLLLKLISEHLTVRNKVIFICHHVYTRTKPQNISLPVPALLKQFQDHHNHQLTAHYDLLFLRQGFPRLSDVEIGELFSILVKGISDAHDPTIFNFLLRSLLHTKLPSRGSTEDTALRESLGVTDQDVEYLTLWFGKLLLLQPSTSSAENPAINPSLSLANWAFLTSGTGKDAWSIANGGLNLTETKIKVLALIGGGMFRDDERLLPVLYASADPNSKVSDLGEDLLKRVLPNATLGVDAISSLFEIYLGHGRDQDRVPRARPPVRIKILRVLSQTTDSLSHKNDIVRIVRDGLLETDALTNEQNAAGRELLKLRSAVVTFVNFVGRSASSDFLTAVGTVLLDLVKEFLENQIGVVSSFEVKALFGNAYQAVGNLAAAQPTVLAEPTLKLHRWLFTALGEEADKDLVVSIDEALSSTLKAFQRALTSDTRTELKKILLYQLKQEHRNSRNVRYAIVRFTNRCFPYNDVDARWIDLRLIANQAAESHETIEEAKKGLDPYWTHINKQSATKNELATIDQISFPRIGELTKCIFRDHPESLQNLPLCAAAVSYCRQSLFWPSLRKQGIVLESQADWERKLDLAVSQSSEARKSIREDISKMLSTEPDFMQALQEIYNASSKVATSDDAKERITCVRSLLEICSLVPEPIFEKLASSGSNLASTVLVNDVEIRSEGSKLFGLLASHSSYNRQRLSELLAEFFSRISGWRSAVGPIANQVHGCTLAIAYYLGYSSCRQNWKETEKQHVARFIPILLEMLISTTDSMIRAGALLAFSQMCIFNLVSIEEIDRYQSFEAVTTKLFKEAQAGNEKATLTLGHAAMILDETDDAETLSNVIDSIHKLHEARQVDTQFAVGEALTCVACGWESEALAAQIPFKAPNPKTATRTTILGKLIDRILGDCRTTKPSLKKASTIWSLCFIQFCGQRDEILSRLAQFQVAFKRCLADRDELVQESAARGLGLIYERGGKELKDDLVRDLIGSFSGDRADMSGTVSEDTQLFEEGALPTGDGSVTTYKDIMNLASEVGDSSLVYKFMSLASNNAIWSSRAAFGKFGLSSVLSGSSVDGYLAENPKLYPKLYRYRFDPNTNVRRSMNDIWNALIKDSNATINTHFQAIIQDLLTTVLGREWRVRQASCAAIADLIQGRELDKVEPYLDEIWSKCFKVLDDIKDSVRRAAASLARVLINTLLRSLETASGKHETSTKMLKGVLPFLFSTQGIESKAEDVKAVSIKTLLEIIKKAQPSVLRSFIPELVTNLIALLSTLEPDMINYIHLNASKYGITEQQVDEARLSATRSSPAMESIDRCLDMLDDDTMKQLCIKLQAAMRGAVGMPSKVGCSRVLVSLSTRRGFLFRPYTDQFLEVVPKHLSDRNDTVASSYAAALGYVARGATDEGITKLASAMRKLYFESDDERSRLHAAEVTQAVAKHATDRFTASGEAFLPFVFIARHDENEHVREIFNDVWNENVGGPRAASLYLKEIIELAGQQLASRRWALKHGAGLAVAAAVKAVAVAKGEIGQTDGEMIWDPLKTALAEKSWDGKEGVLEGFVCYVEKGSKHWRALNGAELEISKIALREARRRNATYRQHSIASLGKVAAACRDDVDISDEVFEIAEAIVKEELDDAGEKAGEGPDGKKQKKELEEVPGEVQRKTLCAAVDALGQSTKLAASNGRKRTVRALDLLTALATRRSAPLHHTVAASIITTTKTLLDRLDQSADLRAHGAILDEADSTGDAASTISDKIVALVASQQLDAMPEVVNLTASEAALALVKLLAEHQAHLHAVSAVASRLHEHVSAHLSRAKSPGVRKNLLEATNMLDALRQKES